VHCIRLNGVPEPAPSGNACTLGVAKVYASSLVLNSEVETLLLRVPGRLLFAAIFIIGFSSGLTRYPAEAQMVTVAKGGPFVLPNNKEQCFTSPIKIEPGQVNVPLKLTLVNGVDNRPGLTWVRVFLTNAQVSSLTSQGVLGTLLAQSNNFAAQRQITVDLNGKVNSGQYAIAVQCGGPAGAACYWAITCAQVVGPTVVGVRPDPAMPGVLCGWSGLDMGRRDPAAAAHSHHGC